MVQGVVPMTERLEADVLDRILWGDGAPQRSLVGAAWDFFWHVKTLERCAHEGPVSDTMA